MSGIKWSLGQDVHLCSGCPKIFKTKKYLKDHKYSVHLGIRNCTLYPQYGVSLLHTDPRIFIGPNKPTNLLAILGVVCNTFIS